ncbi:MAG: signal peptidase I [Deltaproteobacteria bacterium]|jgi:signal peptidase I
MSDSVDKRWRRRLRSAGSLLALVITITSARSSLADHYTVPTGSMEPTIQVGDRILVNKLAFGFRIPFSMTYLATFSDPERGEVVVLRSPVDERTLVKRVVGVPGDQLEVRDGRVFVDGRLLIERHEVVYGPGRDLAPTTIPEGKLLVLGDNRPNSLDGRFFGLVDRDDVYGRAERIYFSDGFTWDRLSPMTQRGSTR